MQFWFSHFGTVRSIGFIKEPKRAIKIVKSKICGNIIYKEKSDVNKGSVIFTV